jgi:hypothetical protein
MWAVFASGDWMSPDQLSFEQQRWGGEGASPPSSPRRAGSESPAARASAATTKTEGILGYVAADTGYAAAAAGPSWILTEGMGGAWALL